MCLIKTLLLLAILVGFTEQEKATLLVRVAETVKCHLNISKWNYEIDYYGKHQPWNKWLKRIDPIYPTQAEDNQNVNVTVETEYFFNEYESIEEDDDIEIYALIRHDCTTDRQYTFIKKTIYNYIPYDSISVVDVTNTWRLE